MTNLPSGVKFEIRIRAFKDTIFGKPFTIPVTAEGSPDETLNLTAVLLRDKRTSVELSWSPPTFDRYRHKEVEYEVHYTDGIKGVRYPRNLVNG